MSKYPFKFYDSYTQSDGNIFFGRDTETKDLYDMIFKTNIILLFGDSGTGKTSLIQCGLANQFKYYDWKSFNIKRKENINQSLSQVLEKALHEGTDEYMYNGPGIGFEHNEILEHLKQIYIKYSRPIYLIFDQFEELYLLGSTEEQERFIITIGKILNEGFSVKIIISIRGEFLKDLYDFEKSVPQLKERRFRLLAMKIPNAEEVIKKSTGVEESNRTSSEQKKESSSSKVRFTKTTFKDSNVALEKGKENEITRLIIKKIDNDKKKESPTVDLILLQFFLDKLYLKITKDKSYQEYAEITLSDVKAMKKIDELMWNSLFEQIEMISKEIDKEDDKKVMSDIWRILYSFITPQGTKKPNTKQELIKNLKPEVGSEVIEKTLTELKTNRILKKFQGSDLYEIAHDSLAKQIFEKLNAEKLAVLGALRIIKAQMEIPDEDMRQYFSKYQLNFIDNNLDELKKQGHIDKYDLAFIEESRNKISDAEKKELLDKQRDEGAKLIKKQMEIETKLKEEAEKAREEAVKSEEHALKARDEAENAKEEAVKSEEQALRAKAEAERAREEAIKSEEQALIAKDEALISKKKANNYSFGSLVLAFALLIFGYGNYDLLEEQRDLSERLTVKSIKLENTIKERDKIEAVSEAKELVIYGDGYKTLEKYFLACENYRTALEKLKDYTTDPLYEDIEKKKIGLNTQIEEKNKQLEAKNKLPLCE